MKSSAMCPVVLLLAAALLLDTGPSSLSEAMPFEAPDSAEAALDEAAATDGSGSGELLEEEPPRDELLPLSERPAVWTRTLGDGEAEVGSGDEQTEVGSGDEQMGARSGDEGAPLLALHSATEESSASEQDPTDAPVIDPQHTVSRSTDSTSTAKVTPALAVIVILTEAGSVPTSIGVPDTTLEDTTLDTPVSTSVTATSPLPETSATSLVTTTANVSNPEFGWPSGDVRSELQQEFCRTSLTCVFHVWAIVCVVFLGLLVLRSVFNNFGSACRWCYQLPFRCKQSATMKAVEFVNIGMDKKSWDNKSACSLRIKAEIETRLRQLFSRCDVTLEMVGSLSSRLGKSLNARPEAEDSMQEYRFTEPVLGADADFMVVLQVQVAPLAAGGRELPWHMLEGVAPYITVSPLMLESGSWVSPLRRLWPAQETGYAGPLDGPSESDIELQEFTPCPDAALSVRPLWGGTPSPSSPQTASPAGGGDAFRWPAPAGPPGPGTPSHRASQNGSMFMLGEEDSVSLGPGADRTDPDGETSKIQRSVSLNEVPTLLRLPTLEASRGDDTPPGFARVQLFLDYVQPEDRHWWRDAMSEREDGALYLSSKKARHLMRDMFETLEVTVQQDRRTMSIVDSCLADYRGDPRYIKDVKARGPAVTLKLTQSDDRAIANMSFLKNNCCCYWICLCLSVILLLPFCVWIFLTGGSWPVRKCSGGACCSIYYVVTLLLPMALVLPVLLLLLTLHRPETDQQTNELHIWMMVAYVALSAFFASLFVCVSQCFFKLPTIFYGDFVTALVCPQWPDDARRFKTRKRQWPPRSEVNGIVRQGCHLVPKPPKPCRCLDVHGEAPCGEAHLLWRYSFSKAEVSLSKSIPEHYRRAYMVFKWLIKKYITKSSCPMYGVGSNMRSYYLKTVLFWELDQQGVMEWSEGVEEQLLARLARRMQKHIQQRHLPHFFIPKINLLDEMTQTDFESVERLMEIILEDPAPLLNMPELHLRFCTIGLCEAVFCTPGRDFRSELCCNYASRLHSVW